MLSSMSFLIPIILQYSIPIILFTCSWFIPESPYWLVTHGKTEAAKESLEKLHGRNHDLNQRLRDIEHTINQQRKAKDITYLDYFKGSNLVSTYPFHFGQYYQAGNLC